MLSYLADENFNGDVVRGLLLRRPDLDLMRVQDVGMRGASDPDVLAWAAENDRIVITHDRATLPVFAYQRIENRQSMPGVFLLNDRLPVAQAIEELLLLDACSEAADWMDRVLHLPL